MRVSGRAPNRRIVFDDDPVAAAAPHAHGFLVDDRRAQVSGSVIIILENGDVLREPEERWLAEPSDELVTLLAKAWRMRVWAGPGGWQTATTHWSTSPIVVRTRQPYAGQERRARN